jgi:hypothetical protein
MRLLTDLGLRRATKDSSSGLPRDQILLDPAHAATNGSTAVSGWYALALPSRKRPSGPGDYSVTTALAIQVYFFSNKV